MLALAPSLPRHLGPFTPTVAYPGDIADTAALEACRGLERAPDDRRDTPGRASVILVKAKLGF